MNGLFEKILFAHIDGLFSGLSVADFERVVKNGSSDTIQVLPQLPRYILALANLDKIDFWADEAVHHIKSKYPLHYQVIEQNPAWFARQKRLVREYLSK